MQNLVSLKALYCGLLLAAAIAALAPNTVQAEVLSDGRLDGFSPINPLGLRPGCPSEVHQVRLTAGIQYIITLRSIDFDPYLILSGNGVLIEDDDSDGGLNARIVFTPTVTGVYTLSATSFAGGARGAYRINVRP